MSDKPKATKARWRPDLWRRERLTLAVGVTALVLLIGVAGTASAQFFGFGGPPPQQRQQPRGGGWFGGDFFQPFQQQAPQQQAPRRREDFSRAPQSDKTNTAAERNVLVLGDSMADWLGYGLEDAYAEQPDMGVVRKHKTVSGLLRYQPKGEPSDWAAAAKGILASEKADAIVIMLGLSDRIPIREADRKAAKKEGAADVKPGDKPADHTDADDSADITDPGAIVNERGARSGGGMVDFRDDRWGELYGKKIEEMINVAKSRGVPVLWVGLPAVRGPKAMADMVYLNNLYRDAAGKAGITYVDIWDGFVDESGRFLQQGPDFEGQIRRLRTPDGVYFTKAGARKMAHYVEREITRLLSGRSAPIALPTEPAQPDVNVVPGAPPPRPLAGPIVPLVAASIGGDTLLGGPGAKALNVDPLVAKTLVKGEPLNAPAGRADDFAWPRREIGREQAKGDVPVAAVTPPAGLGTATAAASPDGIAPVVAPPAPPKQQAKKKTPVATETPSFFGNLFGDEPRRPAQPAASQRPRQQQWAPQQQGGPRPPANVGPAASAPSGFFFR